MRSGLRLTLVSAALLFASTAVAQSDAGASLTRGGEDYALVLAEITAVEKSPDGFKTVKVKVLRVYAGQGKWKGTTFEQGVCEQGSPGVGSFMGEPPPEPGERGLWLNIGSHENNPNVPIWETLGRAKHTPDFPRCVEWAETIERLAGLKPPERLKAARDLCGHRNPRVAELGVELLYAEADDAASREFLKALPANCEASRAALVRLDRFLIVRDGKDWVASDGRKAVLARFTTEAMTEEEGRAVARHLRLNGFQKRVTLTDVAPPLAALAANGKQPERVRVAAIDQLVSVSNDWTAHGSSVIFDPLVGLAKDEVAGVRRSAAAALAELSVPRGSPKFPNGSFTAPQVTVLRKLLAEENDTEVAKALRAAIDKSK
ncbi:---NA--- : : HEAT_2 [Gemmataceae bacterium]|nr:---NA--- : : HEAT_2 [Gemmataceae bacterium]VTT96699.1 ---NA--- : : HEAT_2 [Gemmataceae bacterium]